MMTTSVLEPCGAPALSQGPVPGSFGERFHFHRPSRRWTERQLAVPSQAKQHLPPVFAGSSTQTGHLPVWVGACRIDRNHMKNFVNASCVKVGDTLCFANPPHEVLVQEISQARGDGSIGFHGCEGTWSTFYRPHHRVRIRAQRSIPEGAATTH